MAEIVLGLASSHGPQLEMPPDRWREYGDRSRQQPEHWYAGRTYSFADLRDLRANEHLERECTEQKFSARYAACQQAIAHLGATLDRVAPDVCVIVGDDQNECFKDDHIPALAVYDGDSLDDSPTTGGRMFGDPVVANRPPARITHPTAPELADHLLQELASHDFELSRVNRVDEANNQGAIGHAFHYVFRRLMNNEVIPSVPIIVNTFYPPNVISARRAFALGQALRTSIESWDSQQRVAIVASGGLSHFVIEEELDYRILDGLQHNDLDKLTDYPDVRFRSGTSEIKNWLILAGAMADDGLAPHIVDYVPCYRTEAGHGCAMAFAEWT